MAFDSARSMKKILRFLCGLLINVCIIFVLLKAFSYSYDFAYQVFATVASDPGSTKKVTVEIPQDATLLEVGDRLYDAGVIESKYAFIIKLRVGDYAGQINAGTYQISPSDTNVEIIEMITGTSDGSSGDSGGTAGTEDTEAPDAAGADESVVTDAADTDENTEE